MQVIRSLQRGTLGFNCTDFHSLGNSREGDEHLISASDAVYLKLRAGISCTDHAVVPHVRDFFTGNDDATNSRIRQLQGECTSCKSDLSQLCSHLSVDWTHFCLTDATSPGKVFLDQRQPQPLEGNKFRLIGYPFGLISFRFNSAL